jgi:hypothetical protein
MDDEIPATVPLEVLPADEAPTKKLGWTVREYAGSEVYLFTSESFSMEDLVPLTTRESLKAGDEILVPSLGVGYLKMTVVERNGELSAESEGLLGVLEFGKDDRNAWVCGGLINKRGVAHLKLSTD